MNIYIGGDSYCYSRDYPLWPYVFTHKLNANLKGKGYAEREVGDTKPLTNTSLINHFTIDYNLKFGNALADYCIDKVLVNPLQTKYFDIDFYNK